ncbi:MAG: dipeptide ABC transporter ATP-binding protein [Cyanobacteria bacterium]|nr:dipeptide ABC transporter ATP-binding protein [Cyanobacteriota bacterium]
MPANNPASEPLLEVQDLRKYYSHPGSLFSEHQQVRAVDGVSFKLYAGQTLGLVGESGCGKSTVARTIMRLTQATGGSVRFSGQEVLELNRRQLRYLRRHVQMVFQDPYSSLSPRQTVRQIICEPWEVQPDIVAPVDRERRFADLLDQVGLPQTSAGRYPHEFSGGQRQRIGIARALAMEPKVIICDEPVSALDVSVQAQIINLLEDVQTMTGAAFLFIAHDLSVVKHISDKIAVMYLGKIVEFGAAGDVYAQPSHPYTQALLSAAPVPDPDFQRRRIVLQGDVPSPLDPPSGCRFRTRCWMARDICESEEPAILSHPGTMSHTACHYAGAYQDLMSQP